MNATFTASSSSQAAVVAGLIAAAMDVGVHGITAVSTTDHASGHAAIDLTADQAGIPFTVALTSPASSMTQTTPTANHGIGEDLAAITAFQPDWYCLLIPQRDAATIYTAAEAVEAQRRIFLAQSNDASILATPYNPTNVGYGADIASRLKGQERARTSLWYQSLSSGALAAAVVGRCLSEIPSSITWKFKQLVGVAGDIFTDTQMFNLRSKNANAFRVEAGLGFTFEGTVAEGEYLDVIHGIDKLYSKIQELQMLSFLRAKKIPFNQPGINTLAAGVTAAINESVRDGLVDTQRVLSDGTVQIPAFTVTPPNILDIDSTARGTRLIPSGNPITFEGKLAGAIHAESITGVLSV